MSQSPAVANWCSGLSRGSTFNSVIHFNWTPACMFPGLHAQLLSLAVRKRGEGLQGFITWCMLLLMLRTVASHDQSSSNRTHRTNWTERTNWIQGKKSEGERTNPDVSRLNVTSAATHITINLSKPSPHFLYCKRQKLGAEAWERGYLQLSVPQVPTVITHFCLSYSILQFVLSQL